MEEFDSYDFEETMAAKAAWYYYHQELTQQQISDILGISRMRVIKLLEKAKELGIVRFTFREGSEKRLNTEQELIRKYGLDDCLIVPSVSDPSLTNQSIAKAAAHYIAGRISSDTFINIGYGDTCRQVINYLSFCTEHTVSCVSLTGGVSYYLQNSDFGMMHPHFYLMPAPILVSSPMVSEAMQAEVSIKQIRDLIPLSLLSVVGIGALNEHATILNSGVLTKNDFLILKRSGAVGDLLSHFIDENGNAVSSDIESRVISTSLADMRKLKNVIGVAAGDWKIDAIRAALLGHYLDVLITDENTALKLMSENK